MRTPSFLALVLLALSALTPASSSEPSSIALLERLASPDFEGRGVGTQGLVKARDLLVSGLSAQGFTPGFGASFTQTFSVFTGNELGPKNTFADLNAGEFLPLAFSRSGSLAGAPLVFAGYGITLRAAGQTSLYDDYAGLDVNGKIVVVVLGDPSVGNHGSVFRDPAYFQYSTPMYKVQNAELHGAAGVLLVRDALSQGTEPEPELRFQGRQGGGSTMTILAGQVRIGAIERVLGRSVRELQQDIARTQLPQSFELAGWFDLSVDLKRQVGQVDNVAALVPGTDPGLASQIPVVGAHYDHLGYGGDNSLDPQGLGKVHPGADDNASGVQAVYDLALRVKAAGANRRPVLFVFFSAEEIGLLGSKHLVESLPLPEGAHVVGMLNLDMVGRLDGNRLSVLSSKSAKEYPGIVQDVNSGFGFHLLMSDDGFGSSDHASFLEIKVPSLFFTTGAEPDYHRPSDTADKINVPGLLRIEDFVWETLRRVDGLEQAPTYDPSSESGQAPPRQGRGYGVYFGSIPEFGDTPVAGVLLSGVRPGSPAEKAGLQKGDILTGMGEIAIRNLNDLVFALRYFRPNEEVDVRWVRAGAEMHAETVLKSRD